MRMHGTTVRLLEAMLANGIDARVYGLELIEMTGLKSGTLYPILDRLETAGWLVGEWGDAGRGHARRRYYSLTAEGAQQAQANITGRRAVLARKPRTA